MDEMKGIQVIKTLRSKWILVMLLADSCIAIGTAFLFGVLLNKLLGWPAWWGVLFGIVVFVGLLFFHRVWMIKETGVAKLLNQQYPQLEESADLLLHAPSSLNLLESLQYRKTTTALQNIQSPLSINRKIITPALVLLVMFASALALKNLPVYKSNAQSIPVTTANNAVKKETILPQIANAVIVIEPPAYTAKPAREQHIFNLVAEEGAVIKWQLQTNKPAEKVKFIFNDRQQLSLQAVNDQHTKWQIAKKTDSTGFYQLNIDGHLSELYKIEMIHDKSPVINIVSPKQYTTIDFGEAQQVKIASGITDDYGIKDAFIAATIASGSGEGVKFKEQKIALQGFSAGRNQYQLQQILSLHGLGMQPGDELYFYIQATDYHQQETRSDIHIVHLPDTAQLMSMDGIGNSLTLKPEYFRSQRQIIIDAEQLLKDRDTISEETFKNRSNNLGIDQKLLRLRYGKFLGEEAESGETNSDGLNDVSDFSNADKVRDAFTDMHDNSEDATYLDPETKKQLRAVLTEMWGSELQLRTFKTRDALPFAYKALRLLKDLQQKSRMYVAKTNFKTTPLDLKKRLSGDLTKINESQLQKDITVETDPQQAVRNALSVLERIGTTIEKNSYTETLQQANLRLHEKAIQQPSLYLNAVEALKRVIDALQNNKQVAIEDIASAQTGLQQLLDLPARLPSASKNNSKQALSSQYFNNLQNRQP